ncbi:hypothetical protein KR018_001034 [Drosophila ironensis]|nr:hypothetical protein KR018_001034 [Drosophila ironensis]
MYFKIFLTGALKRQRIPLIRIPDDVTVLRLKQFLEKITRVPCVILRLEFLGETLANQVLLSKIASMCEKIVKETGKDPELVIFARNHVLCKMVHFSTFEMGNPQLTPMDIDMEVDPVQDACGRCSSTSQEASASSSTSCCPSSKTSYFRKKYCCSAMSTADDKKYRDPCVSRCCADESSPPYERIFPEDRRFVVIIINEVNPYCTDFDPILIHLTEQFSLTDEADELEFSRCTSVAPFEYSMMIACVNSESQEWLLRAALPMCPPYRCSKFIYHFEMVRCSFVIPMMINPEWCRILHVMERQNCGLKTSKWSIVSTRVLDACEKDYAERAIYADGKNVEVIVYVDEKSLEYIASHCATIRYHIFHLPIECCSLSRSG